jgi:hypothetical protein
VTRIAQFVAVAAVATLTAPAILAAQNPTTQPRTHAPQPTTAAITAADLKTRLYIFAADSMEGRETGTRGHVKSTDYIEAELKKLGLKPMGDNGSFFQTVPVIRRALDPTSTLSAGDITLKAGTDFVAVGGRGGNVATLAAAPVVFGGMAGDTTNVLPADQTRGKIVLLRQSENAGRGGFGRGGRGGGRGGFGRGASGAVATITVVDQLSKATIDASLHPREGAVQLKPAPTDSATAPTITITAHAAELLLGAPLAGMQKGQAGKTLSTSLKWIDAPAPARNVIAAYIGSDPKLKNEWVALGAHDDHVGIRAAGPVDHDSLHLYAQASYPIRERIALYNLENHICGGRQQTACNPATPDQQAHLDQLNQQIASIHINLDSVRKANGGIRADSINNGADDDGSGSVTLMELAERFAKEKPKTKRSVLFVWHVGEEKGLWGSEWVTDHSPVPRDSIVAQLNMDMVGRGAASDLFEGSPNYLQLVGSHRLSTELGNLFEKLNKEEKAPFTFDYQYDAAGHPENIYCRSDHYNYARFGIPIVFATTGSHGDYHQVTDEPEYIDYPHMAKIGNFIYSAAIQVSDMDHRIVVDGPKPADPHARCSNNGAPRTTSVP